MFKGFLYFITLFLSAFSFISALESNDYVVIKDENPLQILTPSIAKRETLKIRLNNNLEAYLISDPDLDKSGAGLSVNVGSWSNPEKDLGMAHFLEHLLFLGTKKYPEEGGYARFLDEHGGMRNAFTANDRTVYMFSVNNDALAPALDQFSQFFIDPLFNPSGIERESHAIDQEYSKNLQDDNWRAHYVQKMLENQNHPDSRFNIGSLATISNISPDDLKKWYRSHYSANIMHLVVYSTLPLNELVSLVVADFSPIIDKQATVLNIDEPILSSTSFEKIAYIVPYQDIRELDLQWEVPAKFRYDAKSISYVLGYEGPGSLLELLKKEGLAEGISASSDLSTPRMFFSVSISLTEKGVTEVKRVINYCFETINLLKEKGISQELFNEIKQLATIAYEYQSRKDVFSSVMRDADKMIDEPIETFPYKTYVPSKYDPKDIEEFLQQLTPKNCFFILLAKQELSHVPPTTKEPWLGGEFALVPIDKKDLSAWEQAKPSQQLSIPSANPFVPEHLTLITLPKAKVATILESPELVINDATSKLYYAADTRYFIPKIAATFRIHTSTKRPGNAKLSVLTDLYLQTLDYRLSPIAYQGSLAGLHFSTRPIEDGISIQVNGYNEKASSFFKKMLESLKTAIPTEEEFLIFKASLQKEYLNAALEPPLKQANEVLKSIIYEKYITSQKKADALANITREDLIKFTNILYAKTYVEGLVYGNLTKNDAIQLNNDLLSSLKSMPLAKSNIAKKKVLRLDQEQGPYSFSTDIEQFGNATLLFIQDGCYSLAKRSALQILSQGLDALFFDELRTKQQTGYLVASHDQEIERELCALFYVQSNTHDSTALLSRFELFLENILRNLATTTFSKERFQTIREALVSELSQPPKNLLDMSTYLELLAFDYDADFELFDKKVQSLKDLTYEEFSTFTKGFIGKSNHRRLAILVNGMVPKENDLHYKPVSSIKLIRKEGTFLLAEENLCKTNEAKKGEAQK